MSNEDKASPAERFLIRNVLAGTGDPNSLQNVNTALLPNGAVCCVIQDGLSLWVLNKFSTAGTVAGRSLAAGGGGTWFLQASSPAFTEGAELLSTDYNSFACDGNWNASSTNHFALSGTPIDWSLTASGGILTYGGATRDFYVSLFSAVQCGNVGSPRAVTIGISKNDDLTGAVTLGTSGQIDTTCDVAAADQAAATMRKLTLANGDTLRTKMAVVAGASTLSAVTRLFVQAA